MIKKTYLYLGEQNIGIQGPKELLVRIDRNFEETPLENLSTSGLIEIQEREPVEFSRDRSKPYLVTRANNTKAYPGTDFLRYGVCVRTVWKKSPLNYEVENFLPLDETAALNCFKKIYYNVPSSRNKALIHGSLVEVNGEGILIIGGCWSGKTSLTLGFLEKLHGRLVSEGNTLISYDAGHVTGYYLPRPIFVRFHSISRLDKLSQLLTNLEGAESIQPFDREAIREIIDEKRYDLDAGLNISRKKFAELMNIRTLPSLIVDKIIHTEFEDADSPKINSSSIKEFYTLLRKREFPKTKSIGNIKHQREIENPLSSIIELNWIEQLKRITLSFDARKNLTRTLLEDLICFP
ncbi:MAG: hypothetical protein Q8L27_00625 [archaeon]|nr:hypothetical protein [archaeon]